MDAALYYVLSPMEVSLWCARLLMLRPTTHIILAHERGTPSSAAGGGAAEDAGPRQYSNQVALHQGSELSKSGDATDMGSSAGTSAGGGA